MKHEELPLEPVAGMVGLMIIELLTLCTFWGLFVQIN